MCANTGALGNLTQTDYKYNFCLDQTTGLTQYREFGSPPLPEQFRIGSYLGWDNAQQQAAFSNGQVCSLSNGFTIPRSGIVKFGCGLQQVITAAETGTLLHKRGCTIAWPQLTQWLFLWW